MTQTPMKLVPARPAREQLIAIDTVTDEALKVPAYQFAPLIAGTFLEAAPQSGKVSWEQRDLAAVALLGGINEWNGVSESIKNKHRDMASTAFRTIGLEVDGEN